MALNKMYVPGQVEPALLAQWQEHGITRFDPASDRPVYSIDTPPPTVSGHLHIGHVFSYSHADFMARFFRMNGHNVFYPMGYDDNGLPTERLVEKRYGTNAAKVGRQAFIELCLREAETEEAGYRALLAAAGAFGRLALHLPHHRRPNRAGSRSSRSSGWPKRAWPTGARPRRSGARSAARPSPRPTWTTWNGTASS